MPSAALARCGACSVASPLDLLQYFSTRNFGGVTGDEVQGQDAQGLLTELRKYDPSASFVKQGGEDPSSGYTLNYDASKLPGLYGSGSLGGQTGAGTGTTYMPQYRNVDDPSILKDPANVQQSDIYGTTTPYTNAREEPASALDYWGPAAVLGFGALFGGMP